MMGANCKEKGQRKGMWPLVYRWKKESTPLPEKGVDLISNYSPDDQPAFEVDWLPGVRWGEKVLKRLRPLATPRRAPHDPGTLNAPHTHQSCNPSLSDVRQQMLLPVRPRLLSSARRPLTQPPNRDTEKHIMSHVKDMLLHTQHTYKHIQPYKCGQFTVPRHTLK